MRFGSLSAKCANKALVPPIARQACRLDHKPETAATATPQDQACAPRRHFVICYSLLHTFCPKLIGSSPFCIMVAMWWREPRFLSRECWRNGLERSENLVVEFIGFPKRHLASSARHCVERSLKCERWTCARNDCWRLKCKTRNYSLPSPRIRSMLWPTHSRQSPALQTESAHTHGQAKS